MPITYYKICFLFNFSAICTVWLRLSKSWKWNLDRITNETKWNQRNRRQGTVRERKKYLHRNNNNKNKKPPSRCKKWNKKPQTDCALKNFAVKRCYSILIAQRWRRRRSTFIVWLYSIRCCVSIYPNTAYSTGGSDLAPFFSRCSQIVPQLHLFVW